MDQPAMTERIIKADACVTEGAEWLAAYSPKFAMALDETGPLPLRLKPDGFAELLSAIVSQQVSVASANAIWAKMQAAGFDDPSNVRKATEDDLRAAGLSRQKISYSHALAFADIDYAALHDMPTQDVLKTLTAVKGIGVWTAEIYAMFSLGRADVFPSGDLALQESAAILFDLPERPKDKALRDMAADWSPWRSVAARLLWAYYRVAKNREGTR